MNQIKLSLLIILFHFFSTIKAQYINWHNVEQTKQFGHLGIGLDYSVSFNAAYACKLSTTKPIFLNMHISKPAGDKHFDDFKIKPGIQILAFQLGKVKSVLHFSGIYRKYETDLLRLQNFGSEAEGIIGWYHKSWFLAGDIAFDKAIISHFKHSLKYKNDIYAEVKDGWYEPATGGNFSYGGVTGFSHRKLDLTLSFGKIISQDFKTTPKLPFYFHFGVNLDLTK
jgi:hypothetical protein